MALDLNRVADERRAMEADRKVFNEQQAVIIQEQNERQSAQQTAFERAI